MDAELAKMLRTAVFSTQYWNEWGTFTVELTAKADLTRIHSGYGLVGRTLNYRGSCLSPYARTDQMIRLTLSGLEHELLLAHDEVKWIIQREGKVGNPAAGVLWVNDKYRPA
jgi:hypothetical protein